MTEGQDDLTMAVSETRAPRIVFVHTVGFLVEQFRRMAEEDLPGVEVLHVLNESLLKDLLRTGPSPAITRRIVQQAVLAADADVDLVVFTCSSTSPAIDVARQVMSVPVLKIDDPMAEKAVFIGPRIGLLCTASSTVTPSSELLQAHAKQAGKEISISVSLAADAYEALFAGNRKRHDEIITADALKLAETCDVVVLAQASLAHLRESIGEKVGVPVLASPPLLMERLRAEFNPAA
jgi:Asp/Glu/hydantoin racemase